MENINDFKNLIENSRLSNVYIAHVFGERAGQRYASYISFRPKCTFEPYRRSHTLVMISIGSTATLDTEDLILPFDDFLEITNSIFKLSDKPFDNKRPDEEVSKGLQNYRDCFARNTAIPETIISDIYELSFEQLYSILDDFEKYIPPMLR